MQKNWKKFVTDFNDNFSELYVESFILRFRSQFGDKDLFYNLLYANNELQRTIFAKIIRKSKEK